MKVGIIGTGWIAEKAAITLNGLNCCKAYAVGSRKQETADAFAAKWNIKKAYGSYCELIADADVDLIYIGTPHSHHYDVTREAIMAGKPCLVEKAFMACRQALLDGLTEPREMPHAETLYIMQLMDGLRRKWGVHYPMDEE